MKLIYKWITGFYDAWWRTASRVLPTTAYFKAWLVVHLGVLTALVTGNISDVGMVVVATLYLCIAIGVTLLRMAINSVITPMLEQSKRVGTSDDSRYAEAINAVIQKHKASLEAWRDANPKATDQEWEAQATSQMDKMTEELREMGVKVDHIDMKQDATDNKRLH